MYHIKPVAQRQLWMESRHQSTGGPRAPPPSPRLSGGPFGRYCFRIRGWGSEIFQTVRHWWGSGRGKVTARLFVFEFAVVVVGVLVAQALANWVAWRASSEEMQESRTRIDHEQSANLAAAIAWRAAIPCLNQRMEAVMQTAGKGSFDVALAKRPIFADFMVSGIDYGVELRMRRRYGNNVVDRYKAMQRSVAFAANNTGTIIHSWGRLTLADPRLGEVSPQDTTVVRTAAADIRAELRALSYAINDFIIFAGRSGIGLPRGHGYGPARRCDQIWRSGRIDPPLSMP